MRRRVLRTKRPCECLPNVQTKLSAQFARANLTLADFIYIQRMNRVILVLKLGPLSRSCVDESFREKIVSLYQGSVPWVQTFAFKNSNQTETRVLHMKWVKMKVQKVKFYKQHIVNSYDLRNWICNKFTRTKILLDKVMCPQPRVVTHHARNLIASSTFQAKIYFHFNYAQVRTTYKYQRPYHWASMESNPMVWRCC